MAGLTSVFRLGASKTLVGLLLAGLFAATLFASSVLPFEDWVQSLKAWIDGLGAWGFIAFGAVYVLAAVLLLPTWPLSITGGLAFGVWGFVWVPLMATLAASAAFLIGRYIARARVRKWLAERPRYRAVNRAVGEEGWKVVALLRLSPLVPFNILNYFCGVTPVGFPAYVAATLFGIIPGATLYVYLGVLGQAAATGDSLGWAQWLLFGVGLLATVGAVVLITRKVKAMLNNAGLAAARERDPDDQFDP